MNIRIGKLSIPKAILLGTTLSLIFSIPSVAHAFVQVQVNDASQIKYHMGPSDAKVYLRNLDEFNSSILGCCFNYWIDTSTDLGRTMWSTLLSKILSSGHVTLGVASATQEGHLYYVGDW